MKIIFSPAKTMVLSEDRGLTTPLFNDYAKEKINELQSLSINDLNKIYKVSDSLLTKEKEKLDNTDFNVTSKAITSYDGIAYKYLDYNRLDDDSKAYLDNYLIILSGLYGIIRPTDGIINYRLEMNSNKNHYKNVIYDYFKDEDYIINLASKEYSQVINDSNMITIRFLENTSNGYKEKSTSSKITRGLFLRYLAINKTTKIDDLKEICVNGFEYNSNLSENNILTFTKG